LSGDKVLDFSGREVTLFADFMVLNEGTDDTQRIFNFLTRAGGYSEEN
jgi:hypothetical protein